MAEVLRQRLVDYQYQTILLKGRLGPKFEVSTLFERLAEFPLSYPIAEPPFRRALLRRFPYAVYFLPENDRVLIFAVLHQRREPGAWKERFGI